MFKTSVESYFMNLNLQNIVLLLLKQTRRIRFIPDESKLKAYSREN